MIGEILSSKDRAFSLRIPEEKRKLLEVKADLNDRSLQKELLDRIEVSLLIERAFEPHSSSLTKAVDEVLSLLEDKRSLEKYREEVTRLNEELDQQKKVIKDLRRELNSTYPLDELDKASLLASELCKVLDTITFKEPKT